MRVIFFLMLGCMMAFSAFAETAVVIVGISDYASEELLTIDGATAQCRRLETHFEEVGVSEDKILAMCGDEATRSRFADKFQRFMADELKGDDVLTIIWVGHGLTDKDGAKKLLFADTGTEGMSDRDTSMYLDTLLASISQSAPRNIPVLALFETHHKGEYKEQMLLGPSVSDFEAHPNIMAIGYEGIPEMFAMKAAVEKCFRLNLDPELPLETLGVAQLRDCMGQPIAQLAHKRPIDINLSEHLLLKAEGTVINEPKKAKPAGLALLGTGGAITIASAVTYSLATGMREDVFSESPETIYSSKDEYLAAQAKYSTLRALTFGLAGVGLAVTVGGTVVTASPTGVTVNARW